MNKIIYKYGPIYHNNHVIDVKGRIVHAEFRPRGTFNAEAGIYVWAELNDFENETYSPYKVTVVGTGEKYDSFHLKTVVMPDGIVWHIVQVL